MQDKFEFFDELPPELQMETAKHLFASDLVNLSQISRHHLTMFQPMSEVFKSAHYLLRQVVQGEHDAIGSILNKDTSLLFTRSKVTDCSGRIFDNVSAFEYALWALDKHMWSRMIACIPTNEKNIKVFEKLIEQYNKVNTIGVTYRLNGKTITEQHFDFKNTIIKELQTQVDSINTPGIKNWDAIDNQWRWGVGRAQKLLPMHVVYEYCSDEPFYPVPKFISQPKSSKQIYDWITEENENWFGCDSKLGFDFAINKDEGGPHCRASGVRQGRGADLTAIKALCKVRTENFINLKSQLEEQIILDNRDQVFQI
jgi:hypothetical protein